MPDRTLTIAAGEARITYMAGDITRVAADAIVNAANSSLMGGGGVDGAIHRAGGPAILEECRAIRSRQGLLPPGRAVATTAGQLPAKYVIHTVGPVWHGGGSGEAETLASCYRESLALADTLKLRSLSYPAISTGAYGYPVAEAAEVAWRATAGALEGAKHVREVWFVLFDEPSFAAFCAAARRIGA